MTLDSKNEDVPVLIVGGGPVGLALALDLGWRGIRCMLVEKTNGSVDTPKLGAVSIRTMELARRWGIAQTVRETPYQRDWGLSMVFCTSIAGHFLARLPYPSLAEDLVPAVSPEKKWRCPQLWFDPMLAGCARAYPHVALHHSTRLDHFEAHPDRVVSQVTDLQTGQTRTVTSRFLVGCDGPGSTVRKSLGIRMEGRHSLDHSVAIFFRSRDLATKHEMGQAERYYFIDKGGWSGNISAMDGRELWRLTVPSDEQGVEQVVQDARQWVRRALGTDAISFEIISALPWRRSQLTAPHYGGGRVLIAGDSAHTMSPTGGLGMNTGLGDVDNLGWKLQASLEGWAGPGLIDSYSVERQPIGARNAAFSAHNYFALKSVQNCADIEEDSPAGEAMRRTMGDEITHLTRTEWEQLGVHLGYRYEGSPLLVSDGTEAPEDHQSVYVPTTRPGHRAPHVWLQGGSTGTSASGLSTLDLFGRGFVLIRSGKNPPDVGAFVEAAAQRGIPLRVESLEHTAVERAYERPLVLVRPDGHCAWRGDAVPGDVGHVLDVARGAA